MILQTDKNLGPCAMNREDLIRQCATQHLSNEKHYERIDESTAQQHVNKNVKTFLNCMKEPSLKLPLEDWKFLHQADNNITCIFEFYYMPKAHKNKTPTPLWPVTSIVNTKLCCPGKWVTKVLKDATTKVSTYIKDTEHLFFFIKIGKVDKN